MTKRFISGLTVLFMTGLLVISCKSKGPDVDEIVNRMSLKEKIDFIGGYESFHIRAYPQYGIPEINMSDGPVGVRNLGKSTAYPASITLAASWDKKLAGEVGAAIGMEAKSKNVHIMLGPGMNIHRGPYCGRNFEYLGEDPFLAGEIASSYILGMQEQGVVSTAKHYDANYQDFDRHHVSSDMDERTLHEIYLPAFRACVEKGNVGAVMTSYNLINGIYASQNDYLINNVLKKQWQFQGIVMSDWVSTYDGVACAAAGLDLEMPAGSYMNFDTLMPAIEAGVLSEEIINEKVKRILTLYDRFDFFRHPDISTDYILDEDHVRKVAIDAARGGITLLKNEGNMLPLNREAIKKVAVIGVNGDPAVTGGGGSSYTSPLYPLSLYNAIKKVAGEGVEVHFKKALFNETILPEGYFRNSEFYTWVDGKKTPGISAEFFGNKELEGEPVFRTVYCCLDHELTDSVVPGLPEINYSARFKAYFTVKESGNYRISVAGDDGYRVYLNDKLIIEYWQNQAETVRGYDADLKEGEENKVVVEYYQAGGAASIRLGYSPQLDIERQKKQLWEKAKKAASESDVVIFAVGFNRNLESEGFDRTWELPFGQDEMISKLAKLNENTVVVLNAGGNVSMPWLEGVRGLIHAWYPGQEGNLAVAEIVFGITNPSGKLPVSFESRWEDNATFNSYFDEDGDKHVFFTEGIFLGYRHFDKEPDLEPRFPFGFGLSYTTYEYSDIEVDQSHYSTDGLISVEFTIKNTGDREGAEVTQLYVGDRESELPRPVKELKGFEKVSLAAGEEKRISIVLDKSAFSYYNPGKGGWITEPGVFDILIGSSSKDIRLKEEVEITGL